jgi:hypothetical protein
VVLPPPAVALPSVPSPIVNSDLHIEV